jgi:phospholipid/cholesterol/gamma-HCH transport system substrate-binding protein
MNLRIPKSGAIGLVLAVIVSVVLFVYLMGRFGGPTLLFSSQYRVTATLPDTKQLAVRSDVDVRGVKVGQIEQIVLHSDSADVTFSVQSRYAPIYRDATVQVGEKTLLGESYVVLDPGHPATGKLAGGARLPARNVLPASIEIDQALNVLNPAARGHLKAMLETIATGAAARSAPAQLGDTLAQLSSATAELRRLTDVLHGQQGDIAQGVQAARVVLTQLGERQSEVRTIVSGARATLGALATRDSALQAGIAELPSLLSTARVTLHHVRPLLVDARPLLADLRTAAPPLTSALQVLPPVTRAARPVIAGLKSFNAAAVPVLALARTVLTFTRPVSLALPPALRNLVTLASFLAAHRRELAAWFSNTADLGSSRDAKGYFARFFIFIEPGTAFGYHGSFQNNAYTQPGDAAHNQPYSGYPHLLAYTPPHPLR